MCRLERVKAAVEGEGHGRQLESGDAGVEIWREYEEDFVLREPDRRRIFIDVDVADMSTSIKIARLYTCGWSADFMDVDGSL